MATPTNDSGGSLLDPKIRKLSYRLGLAAGLLLILAAVRLQTRSVIITNPVQQWKTRHYDRLRFVDSNPVLGVRRNGTKAEIHRWSPAAGQLSERSIDVGFPFLVDK